MKIKVWRRVHFLPGAFITYTVDGRKRPVVEIYNLDKGYLVLYASMIGGYMRRFYKSKDGAHRWANSYIKEFCKTYWPSREMEIIPA